ncbi:flavodoxin domain-containing protein [Amphibacillus sp. MSJ-3]|uniref:flavodoxin domain-containing protein n=1 Tax=Amphibacillus sp. MSJ-3 TaxID=2841505 RepID=UPI001C0F17F0|nr:flavodoxin domain-containing protein [Amphibacillus sp. MSJ-3]MBU5595637.1 flavodoxin domain-containing protein [Amphibacillus sp. MSJ-3]
MKAAIIYTSVTGNTAVLAEEIYIEMNHHIDDIDFLTIDQVDFDALPDYDIIAIGTYTWGSGELPVEMDELFWEIEERDLQHVITGVFGTGDRFYPYFCGAVDQFRDMLYVQSQLAVTLKVELLPQGEDLKKVPIFCERLLSKLVSVPA